jgi:hypothetical protein
MSIPVILADASFRAALQKSNDVAKLADFVPLYVDINHETVQGWDLLETILAPGDVLYLTMPATRLNQLWREEGRGIGV